MRLVIENDAEGVAVHAAKYIVEQIKAFNPGPNKFYVLGLPTGLCILFVFLPKCNFRLVSMIFILFESCLFD